MSEESLQVVRSLPALSTLTLSGVQSLSSNRVLELMSGERCLLPLMVVGLSLPPRLMGRLFQVFL